MKKVFADTSYWIALANPNDNLHTIAKDLSKSLKNVTITTTDEVLGELLTYFSSKYGSTFRQKAAQMVRYILNELTIEIIPQTRESFLSGLELYEKRPDKEYSFVDCISIDVMRRLDITEALTGDIHFTQENFIASLVKK